MADAPPAGGAPDARPGGDVPDVPTVCAGDADASAAVARGRVNASAPKMPGAPFFRVYEVQGTSPPRLHLATYWAPLRKRLSS
ncbi:hypothetical protein [Streptomyces olivochromogenes]|uniref:Uncharacterized protein n=1 Tax=Streptomyces olivochromogenes TaxID=1963 RepID=A0A250VK35_STROL|nr:hypothetical protein AQJ27_35415 [Streptomyces olivochromogenes]GAX54563.1 hypothetical protein SO3561_06114 [Streptomyces olivochromogenes]